jgi:hypothetical protein
LTSKGITLTSLNVRLVALHFRGFLRYALLFLKKMLEFFFFEPQHLF